MQKYHDEPKQYKGYLKSALNSKQKEVFNFQKVAAPATTATSGTRGPRRAAA